MLYPINIRIENKPDKAAKKQNNNKTQQNNNKENTPAKTKTQKETPHIQSKGGYPGRLIVLMMCSFIC